MSVRKSLFPGESGRKIQESNNKLKKQKQKCRKEEKIPQKNKEFQILSKMSHFIRQSI